MEDRTGPDNTARNALQALLNLGAQKAVCVVNKSELKELNVENGRINLLRSTFDTDVRLSALVDDRKGTATTNKTGDKEVSETAAQALELAHSSEADPANDIAERQEPATFRSGAEGPDLDLMYERLSEFLEYVRYTYPYTVLERCGFTFVSGVSQILNSNQVNFSTRYGYYGFRTMFVTRRGEQLSSANGTRFFLGELQNPLHKCAALDMSLRQNAEQLTTKPLGEKFEGDVIVAPQCLAEFLEFFTQYISDSALIAGSSVYGDKMNKKIASRRMNLHSLPVSESIVTNYFVTADGNKAQNSTIIEHGVLRSFLLTMYGSRKTGLPRSANDGGCYVVDPGDVAYEDIIKNTAQGILLGRFSGVWPANNGDFSGVAKNSYYVKDGEIQWPLSETMISGNLVRLLQDVVDVSTQRVNLGDFIVPWVRFSGVTVSG